MSDSSSSVSSCSAAGRVASIFGVADNARWEGLMQGWVAFSAIVGALLAGACGSDDAPDAIEEPDAIDDACSTLLECSTADPPWGDNPESCREYLDHRFANYDSDLAKECLYSCVARHCSSEYGCICDCMGAGTRACDDYPY
jgi:hypothetical protein